MARKRVISPELFTSESVAALPVATRYTWVGLLCYLDDTGRGKDNPALVKASVWPLDDAYTTRKVAADLDRLVQNGSLCRYACHGAQVHVPTWDDWQKISHPTPTKLCPCPSHEGAAHELHRMESGDIPEALRSRSGATPRNVVQDNVGEGSSSGRAGSLSAWQGPSPLLPDVPERGDRGMTASTSSLPTISSVPSRTVSQLGAA